MKKMFSKRRLKLADINRSALENPEAFIEEENQRYSDGWRGWPAPWPWGSGTAAW